MEGSVAANSLSAFTVVVSFQTYGLGFGEWASGRTAS